MLRIVPTLDLTNRSVVDALILDALRHGRPVPKPVAEAFWTLADGEEAEAFHCEFAIHRADVPREIDTRRVNLIATAVDDERYDALEAGEEPTDTELRLWQAAWLRTELYGRDPNVAGAICLLPLEDGGGAVAAMIVFGHEAYGYRIERVGFFATSAEAENAMRERFLLSRDQIDDPDEA